MQIKVHNGEMESNRPVSAIAYKPYNWLTGGFSWLMVNNMDLI